jgi:hypothetical protein
VKGQRGRRKGQGVSHGRREQTRGGIDYSTTLDAPRFEQPKLRGFPTPSYQSKKQGSTQVVCAGGNNQLELQPWTRGRHAAHASHYCVVLADGNG